MILYSIVLLTIVSISLRITILGLEAAMFTIDRADDLRKVGETVVVQSTRLSKNKKIYRTARTLQIGIDFSVSTGKTILKVGKQAGVYAIKQSLKLLRFIITKLRDLLLALETIVLILDIVVFLILTASSAGFLVLYCTTNEEGQLVYNEDVLTGLGVSSSTSEELESESASGSSNSGNFTKYEDLSVEELQKIARLCYREQGTVEGAAAEASLMCNLYESSRGEGYSSVYDYARNSGWFANAANHMDSGTVSNDIISVVTAVIKEGKRVLPKYIDEHDCVSDISSATNNGASINPSNRDDYQQHITKIENVYGSSYTFYCFPASNSDPFGYTSQEKRNELGDDCYSIDSLKLELGL